MFSSALRKNDLASEFLNDNYCTATMPVSSHEGEVASGGFGELGGCVFKVGADMYFVPTQRVAEDVLYIACDAQKIEGPLEDWRSRLSLGDIAEHKVEDAICDHLTAASRKEKQGEAFVVTRDGKTFRL